MKPVPGIKRLFVDENGKVFRWRVKAQKFVEVHQTLNWAGYPIIHALERKWTVHRLVLRVFVGEPKPGQVARHLDGTRTNNHISNLVWGTPAENMWDKSRHGTMSGERHPLAILTDAQVLEVRRRVAEGEQQRAVAKGLGLSVSRVASVCRGDTWKHLPMEGCASRKYREKPIKHGTLYAYRKKCQCELCVQAMRDYYKRYFASKKVA